MKITRRNLITGSAAGLMLGAVGSSRAASQLPEKWDFEADVVVVGAGACGLPAAIVARQAGYSVLVLDCNYDIGGHAIISVANVPLGGGTSAQKKFGIEDDPETVFRDLTDWTVVKPSGFADYRRNDRAVQHSLAYNAVATYDFLVASGVHFLDQTPDNAGGNAIGVSAMRENHPKYKGPQCAESPAGQNGSELMRPLEKTARDGGVQFLLNYHMDELYREEGGERRVVGLSAHYTPTIFPGMDGPLPSFRSEGNISCGQPEIRVRARVGVVIATGGSSGNVEFRRMFDPRLTAELACAGEEYSPQDASGELAGIRIGAALWGTGNQTTERACMARKRNTVGVRTNYLRWDKASPIFPRVKYSGVQIKNWQNAIVVNQAGRRFYDEMQHNAQRGSTQGHYKDGKPYVQGDWRNTLRITYRPRNYVDAALAINEGSQAPDWSAGPQWAIFDSEACRREHMAIADDTCDPNLFFVADTIEQLAEKINTSTYSTYRMDPKVLAETVARYNSLVEKGVDEDFDKPKPKFQIKDGPFYAAWSTVMCHDTFAGLRIDGSCRVCDWAGKVINGLYCGGESAGGSSQHGLGRSITQGYIIGKYLAGLKG